jgi:hypothetical protein
MPVTLDKKRTVKANRSTFSTSESQQTTSWQRIDNFFDGNDVDAGSTVNETVGIPTIVWGSIPDGAYWEVRPQQTKTDEGYTHNYQWEVRLVADSIAVENTRYTAYVESAWEVELVGGNTLTGKGYALFVIDIGSAPGARVNKDTNYGMWTQYHWEWGVGGGSTFVVNVGEEVDTTTYPLNIYPSFNSDGANDDKYGFNDVDVYVRIEHRRGESLSNGLTLVGGTSTRVGEPIYLKIRGTPRAEGSQTIPLKGTVSITYKPEPTSSDSAIVQYTTEITGYAFISVVEPVVAKTVTIDNPVEDYTGPSNFTLSGTIT